MKPQLTIRVSLIPGRCRWCGCTYERPCANGCGWADRTQTLCTECAALDHATETATGRRALADFLQEHGFLVPVHERRPPGPKKLRGRMRTGR